VGEPDKYQKVNFLKFFSFSLVCALQRFRMESSASAAAATISEDESDEDVDFAKGLTKEKASAIHWDAFSCNTASDKKWFFFKKKPTPIIVSVFFYKKAVVW